MVDFLIDMTNIPSYQTIYITILVSLMVKYFWVTNVQTTVSYNEAVEQHVYVQPSIALINLNVQQYNTPILHWICKNIRKRVKSAMDDPEKPHSFIFYC